MCVKFRVFQFREEFYPWVFKFAIYLQSRKSRNLRPAKLSHGTDKGAPITEFHNKKKNEKKNNKVPQALVKRAVASRTCVETYTGWPNGLARILASTQKSQKTHIKTDISCISRLMGVTQLALTWVGRTVKNLRRLALAKRTITKNRFVCVRSHETPRTESDKHCDQNKANV